MSSDVLKTAINEIEEDFLKFVNGSWHAKPAITAVGSCCLVGAIAKDVLYIANLGDSRAVLGRRLSDGIHKSVIAERLTTGHNVAEEEILKELLALHPDDSHIVIFIQGVWRIKGILKLWDLPAGKLLHEFKCHEARIQCIDSHPHEFLFASARARASWPRTDGGLKFSNHAIW